MIQNAVTSSPQNNQELNPLGKLVSLVALLAAALYFTGWIYRWAYFGFFQIEVTTLNLPAESFYLAAFRSLVGNLLIFFRTAIALIVAVLAIILTQKVIAIFLERLPRNFHFIQQSSFKFLSSLINEFVIVLGILAALFFLAQWQGDRDAFRDAVNETSRLPVVTIIMGEDNAPLGRDLDNPLINPSGFRIIGDRNLYNQLLGKELTDTSNQNQPRVWRLLIDRDGYFYIFPALPNKDRNLSVPVLMIHKSSEQLIILSPKVSEK